MIKKVAFTEKNQTYIQLQEFITKLVLNNNVPKSSVSIQMDQNEVLIKFTPEG